MDVMKKTLFLLIILLSLGCLLSAQEVSVTIDVEQTGSTGLIEATFVIPQGYKGGKNK